MGTYAVDEDWSSGHSGHPIDTHLFNVVAQDAAGEWQVARPKKPIKPVVVTDRGPTRNGATGTGTGACTTCPCFISKGRYGALSDTSYDSDLDFDIPMMMKGHEEGDVSP